MLKQKERNGFTLVEVLVALGIFILIVAATVEIFIFGWRSNSTIWEQLSAQNEGRKAVQDFTNQLRTASASSIGAYTVESAANQQIIFYSDIDHDSLRERVRYFLSGTTFKRGVIKPSGNPLIYNPASETITDVARSVANGANPIFYYYDKNYSGAGAPLSMPVNVTAIRVVEIYLKLDRNPQITPAPLFVESKVMIRNLKDN